MKFSVYNIGCKVNYAELSEIKEKLVSEGGREVPFGDSADLIVINTCTVTSNADADCRKIIRRAVKSSPEAYVAVVGCYAQLKSDEILKIDGVSGIFGGNEKFRILDLVKEFKKIEKPEVFLSDREDCEFHSACSADNSARTRTVLKIQDGCDYFCSYCAVPYARGKSRSMNFDQISKEYDRALQSGTREIILSGINLGEYRSPEGKNFTDVLSLIDARNDGIRTRISSIEPNLLTDEIIRLTRDSEAICRHFHIPLQSGSDRILTIMRRKYTTDFFASRIEKIKKEMPDCSIGLDVITGFPGESDEEFEKAFAFLAGLDFTYLHVFSYSERSEAVSSRMVGKVPHALIKDRTKRLRELSDSKNIEFMKMNLGRTMDVLPETYSAKNDALIGHTSNYVKVKLLGTGKKIIEPVSAKLQQIDGDCVTGIIVR